MPSVQRAFPDSRLKCRKTIQAISLIVTHRSDDPNAAPRIIPTLGPQASSLPVDKPRLKLRMHSAPAAFPAMNLSVTGTLTSDSNYTEQLNGSAVDGGPDSQITHLIDQGDGMSLQPIPAALRQNSNKENSPGNRKKAGSSGRSALGAIPEAKADIPAGQDAAVGAAPMLQAPDLALDLTAPLSPPCCGGYCSTSKHGGYLDNVEQQQMHAGLCLALFVHQNISASSRFPFPHCSGDCC